MKLLPCMLLAIAVFAQSRSVPCGASSAAAADPVPSGGPSPVAAKAADSHSSQPGPAPVNVAAQIQLRRPPVRSSFPCSCGTVGAGSLTAPANSQEVLILTGLAGSFRFDHVLLRETTRFSSDSAGTLEVGVGRSNLGADVVPRIPLKSDSAPDGFWNWRPNPPQLAGAYDLVLNFKASGPLGDGAVSNFSSGTVTWEVCGYNATPAPVR
jgi:hypothetical protein